jgi:hypothetical protein
VLRPKDITDQRVRGFDDGAPPIDVSIEDVKRVREILCEYILKETIDRKGNFYSGAP